MSEELKTAKESDKKPESVEEGSQQDEQPGKDEPEAKTSKLEEEGEIEDGEETPSTSKPSSMELKELRASLK